jgi:hypothetical protein
MIWLFSTFACLMIRPPSPLESKNAFATFAAENVYWAFLDVAFQLSVWRDLEESPRLVRVAARALDP